MRKITLLGVLLIAAGTWTVSGQNAVWTIKKGSIHFTSDAPLEKIEADCDQLKGVLNPQDNRFAFNVEIDQFEGFNSSLQQVHFNENYMESVLFPKASFTGKIIEKVNFGENGKIPVRAKGILEIHGVKQERIIPVNLEIENQKCSFTSNFNILLPDHDISVPRIVFQKVSQTIQVSVKGELAK